MHQGIALEVFKPSMMLEGRLQKLLLSIEVSEENFIPFRASDRIDDVVILRASECQPHETFNQKRGPYVFYLGNSTLRQH